MKKVIVVSILASSVLALQGCGEYKPEVNAENCALPYKETREKFKNDDKWRMFNSECSGFKARKFIEPFEADLKKRGEERRKKQEEALKNNPPKD